MNPLLHIPETPFSTPPFSQIKNEHFLPAIKELIEVSKTEINEITSNDETPDFYNTIEALERSGKLLDRASSIFFNLNSAETNDELQAIARDVSPLLSEFSNDILLNEALFTRVKAAYENTNADDLTSEQKTLLEKTYKGFVRNGALLGEDDKQKLREVDVALSKLSLEFGEHVLAETNRYELVLENEKDLDGLPNHAKEMAAHTAKEKGHDGKWVITLDYPSYVPFVTYATNRDLRKKIKSGLFIKSLQR